MAQASAALKQNFESMSVKPVSAARRSVVQDNNAASDEDMDAINAVVNELIRLDARGQRLNILIEDAEPREALEQAGARFRDFGLSNRFSETLITAVENSAVSNGIDFARKQRLLSIHMELTDKEPEQTKGRNRLIIAFDGKQKHGAQFSTVQMHYTASGTKTTTTSGPDLENMFVNKVKYLVITYEGQAGEALNSPENISADLGAIAAGGGLPAELVEELQAAIDNGTITADQAELIQAVAELNRVVELTAVPGAVENPAAAIERLKDAVTQALQGSDIPAALAEAADKSVVKTDIIVSSPEFSALITQGAAADLTAHNDNEVLAEAPDHSETMEILEQAGMDEAMTITLTSEQQATLRELVEGSELPAAEKSEMLAEIADGTIERSTFSKIETAAVESGAVLPEGAAAAIAEIKASVSAQDLSNLSAAQTIALTEPQKQALEQLVQQQDIPATEREQILAQIENGSISRDSLAAIEKIAVESPAAAKAIAEIRDVAAVQDKILPVLAEQKIFLSEAQQLDLKEIIAKQDLPPHVAEALMDQVKTQSVSVETIARLSAMDKVGDLPVITELQTEARQVVRDQQGLLDVPVSVPLTPMVKDAVIDAIQKMDIPASAKQNFIAEVQNETPSRGLVSAVAAMTASTPALEAFRGQAGAHFERENKAQIVHKIEDHIKSLPASTPPETKTFIKNVMTDLQNGRPVSWVNQVKMAQMAPDLSVKIAGIQSFKQPAVRPEVLIEQIKQAHENMAKKYPLEAKVIDDLAKRMQADPKNADSILKKAIKAMPAEGSVFKKFSEAVDKVQATPFQPREGQRERMIVVMEQARDKLPPSERLVFDKVLQDLKLGNPVERSLLNETVVKAPDIGPILSEGFTPDKTIVPVIKEICPGCPHGGDCANCGKQFKPAASVAKVERDEKGRIIQPEKSLN